MRLLKGLSNSEVLENRKKDGWNEIPLDGKIPIRTILWRQINQPLVWLLLGASLLSFFFGDKINETFSILAILCINIFIGVFQESKAENELEALREYTVPMAKILRESSLQSLPSREIVTSDILFLESGDIVSADAIILDAHDFQVNEAIITGESLPVVNPKKVKSGTFIVKGTAWVRVEKIGMQTELGLTAKLLKTSIRPEVPLQIRLKKMGIQILIFCIVLVSIVGAISLYQGRSWFEVFFFSISLMVATVPEGLPVIVSLALALGVRRMAKKKVLVRQLSSVETLGSVTVICTDKTGTLTYGEMRLTHYLSDDPELLFNAAISCVDAEFSIENNIEKVVGDPMEIAILKVAYEKFKLKKSDVESKNPRIKTEPFDSESRQMQVLRQDGFTYIKGAFEVLSQYLNPSEQVKWLAQLESLTKDGLRVLAVAKKTTTGEFIFLGLLGFSDPPRKEALESVKAARNAGVRTVMITGDHELTAKAIAKDLEIDKYYARVTASRKLELVREFVNKGEIVAMTGDGVNDAPALKEAHVGIAMGKSGTAVTKETAHIILMDDNFSHIVSAIREGRGIFQNIRKAIVYLLSGNFGELSLIFISSFCGLPLPLIASQLLWINLVTDGVPSLVLVTEVPSQKVMKDKPRLLQEAILGFRQWFEIIIVGLAEGIMAFIGFYEFLPQGLDKARSIAFMILIFTQILRLFSSMSSVWRETVFWKIIFVILLTLGIQSLLSQFELTRNALGLFPLTIDDFLKVIELGLLVPTMLLIYNKFIKNRI
jgi:Ca2+-transporting ATPase